MSNEEKILKILEQMQGDIGTMQGDITGLKHSVAKIEIEHGQHLKTLHDGYSLLYNRTERVHRDIKVLNFDMKHVKLDVNDIKHDLCVTTKEATI